MMMYVIKLNNNVTVLDKKESATVGYLAYCERVYHILVKGVKKSELRRNRW